MSLLSNFFSRPYGLFKSDNDEISLDSLVLLNIDDLKKAIRDEVQVSLENKVSESLVRALTVGKIKDELKEHAVSEALKITEKYSDSYPKRRNSKQTLELHKDFVEGMLHENKSSLALIKELHGDESTFNSLYLPVVKATASHSYRFVLKNMKEDAFSYFLKLTTMMTELSKESTYLHDDFGRSKASLAVVLYASAFVISKLLYESHFTYGKEKQCLSLLTTSFEDLLLKENVNELSITATPCDCMMRPEQLVSIGLLMLKDKACNIVSYLKAQGCDKLLEDLVKPEITSRLYTLLQRARELILKNESYKDCEFLEAVRPVFVGVPHTPENWFSDPKFNGENYFYPDEVLQKVKLHKSICCYVNHSKKAVETFVSSYKKLQEKIAQEKEKEQSFKNERTLLNAAANIDFNKRKQVATATVTAKTTSSTGLTSSDLNVSGEQTADTLFFAPSLEDLMLGTAKDSIENSAVTLSSTLSQDNTHTELSTKPKHCSHDCDNMPITVDRTSGKVNSFVSETDNLMSNIMSSDAIVNRFSYQQSLSDVTDPQVSDSNAIKAYKLIISRLKAHTFSSNVLKRALDSRVSRIKSVIDVVNGFIKDGAFAIDFDLDNAVKSATTYVDYSRALLATRYSAMHDYKRNKVGVDYLNHFIEKEIVFLSKVLNEQN